MRKTRGGWEERRPPPRFPDGARFIFAWLVLFSRRRSRSLYLRTWHKLVSQGKVSSYLQKTGKDCNCLQPRQGRESAEVLLHSLVLVSCCYPIISLNMFSLCCCSYLQYSSLHIFAFNSRSPRRWVWLGTFSVASVLSWLHSLLANVWHFSLLPSQPWSDFVEHFRHCVTKPQGFCWSLVE